MVGKFYALNDCHTFTETAVLYKLRIFLVMYEAFRSNAATRFSSLKLLKYFSDFHTITVKLFPRSASSNTSLFPNNLYATMHFVCHTRHVLATSATQHHFTLSVESSALNYIIRQLQLVTTTILALFQLYANNNAKSALFAIVSQLSTITLQLTPSVQLCGECHKVAATSRCIYSEQLML